MVATRALVLVSSLVMLTSCEDKRDLPHLVQSHCSQLVGELEAASAKYSEFAGWVAASKLDQGQRTRAESQLPYGATFEQRAPVTHVLAQQISFCAMVREGGFEMLDAVSVAFARFREQADPVEVARALADVLATAKKLAELPLKD